MYANMGQGDPQFDLTSDGRVDQVDGVHLLETILGIRYGDTDLDGDVDLIDFNAVRAGFDPRGTNPENGWSARNFDGDDDVDFNDLSHIAIDFSPWGYSASENLNNLSQEVTMESRAIDSEPEVLRLPVVLFQPQTGLSDLTLKPASELRRLEKRPHSKLSQQEIARRSRPVETAWVDAVFISGVVNGGWRHGLNSSLYDVAKFENSRKMGRAAHKLDASREFFEQEGTYRFHIGAYGMTDDL